MSVGRAALTVGGLTALSRIAGFVRDLLIAAAWVPGRWPTRSSSA